MVSALLAVACARRTKTLLLDADGDLPSIFGVQVGGSGVREWWAANDTVGFDALERLATPITPALSLVPAGDTTNEPAGFREVPSSLQAVTVVDAGTVRSEMSMGAGLVTASDTSILVLRPCYLAARRAAVSTLRVDGIVIVEEPGRALKPYDIAEVVGVPILATVPWDLSIARVVDAGRVSSKLPRAAKRLDALAKNLISEDARVV